MFALASKLTANGILSRFSIRLMKDSRVMYTQGDWPEPITQQTLQEFLQHINYFQEPRNFLNIGLKLDRDRWNVPQSKKSNTNANKTLLNTPESQVDDLLKSLGEEAKLPSLDVDDTLVNPEQLACLALNHGIYRDLFDCYLPTSDYIKFTPQQAENLNRLIPFYWITDLPYSRLQRNQPKAEPLKYFEPVINIYARFIHEQKDSSDTSHYAHVPYHGNIIPASEALVKPSITLDGRWLRDNPYCPNLTKPSKFENWTPSNISCCNFPTELSKHYYSIIMLNLDSLHPESPNLHWFVTNIAGLPSDGNLSYEEVCDYLPVHGIRGFGYSRYVFLALQHDSKLDLSSMSFKNFSLESRKFDMKQFLEQNKDKNIIPVGVSWFQTSWDESSNKVFHDYMKMKAPVYDAVQPKYLPKEVSKMAYPGKIPFNIFLDHCRDSKNINEQVLLERLKTVDPYDYRDQYEPPKVPPTVFDDEKMPDWMINVNTKKKSKVGYWRGLRPASATLPLNNNADLDEPIRPFISSELSLPGFHNQYRGKPVLKKVKDLPYSKPANEHQSAYIQKGSEIYIDSVREIVRKYDERTKDKMKDS